MPILSGGNVIGSDGLPRNIFTKASALAANDFAGQCAVGSLALNTASGTYYVCTATNGSTTATWGVLGAQAGP